MKKSLKKQKPQTLATNWRRVVLAVAVVLVLGIGAYSLAGSGLFQGKLLGGGGIVLEKSGGPITDGLIVNQEGYSSEEQLLENVMFTFRVKDFINNDLQHKLVVRIDGGGSMKINGSTQTKVDEWKEIIAKDEVSIILANEDSVLNFRHYDNCEIKEGEQDCGSAADQNYSAKSYDPKASFSKSSYTSSGSNITIPVELSDYAPVGRSLALMVKAKQGADDFIPFPLLVSEKKNSVNFSLNAFNGDGTYTIQIVGNDIIGAGNPATATVEFGDSGSGDTGGTTDGGTVETTNKLNFAGGSGGSGSETQTASTATINDGVKLPTPNSTIDVAAGTASVKFSLVNGKTLEGIEKGLNFDNIVMEKRNGLLSWSDVMGTDATIDTGLPDKNRDVNISYPQLVPSSTYRVTVPAGALRSTYDSNVKNDKTQWQFKTSSTTPPPTTDIEVTLDATNATLTEESGNSHTSTITANLTSVAPSNVTIPLIFSGTATTGDYTLAPGTITVAAGTKSGNLTITTTDDATAETEESLDVELGVLDPGYTTGSPKKVSLKIVDNDSTPANKTVKIAATSASIKETGETESTFTVTLSAPATSNLDVPIVFDDAASTAGTTDYTTNVSNNKVTIAAGQSTKSFMVKAKDDTVANEGNETLIVKLGTVTGYTTESGKGSVTLTIEDNDGGSASGAPVISGLEVDPEEFDPDDDEDTTITFTTDKVADIRVKILDEDGDDVCVLVPYSGSTSEYPADEYEVKWDGTEDSDCENGDIVDDGDYTISVSAKNASGENTDEVDVEVNTSGSSSNDDDDTAECDVDYDDADDIDDDELCEAVKWVTDEGIFEGYSDDTFRPSKSINRVELIKVLMLGFDVPEKSANLDFSDTSDSAWYNEYLETAVGHKIAKGDTGKDTFRPGDVINRVETLKLVFQTLRVTDDFDIPNCNDEPYSDVDSGEWYIDYVCLSEDYDDLFDVSNDRFKPSANVTRGEAALVLYRLHDQNVID